MTATLADPPTVAGVVPSREERAAGFARIERLVVLRNRIDAEIAEEVRAAAQREVEARLQEALADPERVEASIVGQLGLALRISPTRARTQLRLARDLHAGLDTIREAFAAGELDERRVAAIVAAARHLDPTPRAELDRRLAAHDLPMLGVRKVADLARSVSAAVAPEKFAERARAARRDRHVSISSAEDGMAVLRALLPMEQAITCYAALRKAVTEHWVSPEPVTRTRGQIMADTLVERLTGESVATPTQVEIQVLVPVESLLDRDSPLPAEIPGFGPTNLLNEARRVGWRRLVTRDGIVIGGDSRRRAFGGVLADWIRARDHGRCTEPGCDAPIAHLDHRRRWSEGGPTSLDNGRGTCAFHNQLREQPGWHLTDHTTTTPTGRRYSLRS
ncbi:HNH endonuclease signature motif containing protein [Pseudonocardia oroxyli]|uniref:HNH endonuclease signature motif containing protein n=1 Tax=Pseudonocardia oroxyli TaxID=366584 RepID=UPI0015A40CDD|nr:HNH endonuclease signature motif containing protein [Pseudonocardia oroxyli]